METNSNNSSNSSNGQFNGINSSNGKQHSNRVIVTEGVVTGEREQILELVKLGVGVFDRLCTLAERSMELEVQLQTVLAEKAPQVLVARDEANKIVRLATLKYYETSDQVFYALARGFGKFTLEVGKLPLADKFLSAKLAKQK